MSHAEEWLGQVLIDGQWMDFARGTERASREWQEQDPENRRVVDWISRKVLVPSLGEGLDVFVQLQAIGELIDKAQKALSDEAEGRLRSAVFEAHARLSNVRTLIENW